MRLSVPSHVTSLRVLRVTAAAAASDVIEDIDALDALRLAVDELAVALIQAAEAGSELHLTVERGVGEVRVSAVAPANGISPTLSEVGATLVRSGSSTFDLRRDGERVCFEATFPAR